MPNRRLVRSLIDALEPEGSVWEVRDTQLRDFGIRIMPSGGKGHNGNQMDMEPEVKSCGAKRVTREC